MISANDPFLADIRSTYGRLAYTHKTQEKEAERKTTAGHRLRVANVGVFAITAAATVLAPLIQSEVAAWVAAFSAAVGLVFTAIQLSFDPATEGAAHRSAAKSYLSLRNSYARLVADTQSSGSITNSLRARRDQLSSESRILDEHAPQTSAKAYAVARKALREDEELTFSSEELDTLLPPQDSN